jgi:gliding motility-associated-like protein
VPEVRVVPWQQVCLHDTIQFQSTVAPPYPNYTYSWTGPNGFVATTVNPVLSNALFADSGSYVIAIGLDTNRCVGRDTFHLKVTAPPPPITAPVIFCLGKPASMLKASGMQLTWFAEPEGGTRQAAIVPPTSALGITQYYVSQTSAGCESERSVLPVEVKVCCDKPVFIPTAFTPNGDGHNDIFTPKFPGYGNSAARLRVYNRWGQMIFQSFDGHGWNGTWNGVELAGGTYFYELLVDCKEGTQQLFTGDIMIVR